MRISFSFPTIDELGPFLEKQKAKTFSYKQVGATQGIYPSSFAHDHTRILIGKGESTWQKAKAALQSWQQFPSSWTKVYAPESGLKEKQTVVVMFRLFGIWWINSTRIIYVFDEPNRYGFAYSTLPGHVERGEEVFWIERNEEGEIFYHIDAFSKPAYWFVWLGYPIARAYQRKFQRESMAKMKTL